MNKIVQKMRYVAEDIYGNVPLLKMFYVKPLKRLYKKIVRISTPEFIYAEEFKIYLDKNDCGNRAKTGLKDTEEFEELMKNNIKEGDTVLNIGANIGIYSLIMSRYVGESGKVYAFEPSKDNMQLLKKTIEYNNLTKIIIPIEKAVSNKKGKIKLFLSEFDTGNNQIFNTKEDRDYQEVDVIKLDDVFKKDFGNISFILMDIEGSELNALEGMENIIRKNKNIKIISEFSPTHLKEANRDPNEFLEKIKSFGFNIYEINGINKLTKIVDLGKYVEEKNVIGSDIYLTRNKHNVNGSKDG